MIYRVFKGKEWQAIRNKRGLLVLGDPKKGEKKHITKNAVEVLDEARAIELIKYHGYSIRVESETKHRPSLVRRNLFANGDQLTS